ncbi:hypothetical protein SK3146_02884 [Paenibacillus konkukensis]|uniref:Alpha-L-rhamnosidase n=1 Tax=Paenibacillus konkukensis TaxID=2020716 RepID=A0ABY4RQP5_9BACL|nr:glycosyl hydrolase [Paenibacillus konkukensis]UQZ83677.1 hypothetical protein SK3146_02884 [Paenibacillus konkukensis]
MKEWTELAALKKAFPNPPAAYRSMPFWSWNDELREEELVRQIEDMNEQGMGGFFMHSRDGLETPYMGEQWMEAVKASVARAESLGMHAWLYDEDRWPSGSAGGTVPARGDEYRAKGLTVEVTRGSFEPGGCMIALFKAVIDGMRLQRCERLPLHETPVLGDNETLLVFRIEVSAGSEWFNGEAPPDSMNEETVARFIESTYERYKDEVGEQFGKAIRGIFTDEPSVHDRHCRFTAGRGWLPWTYTFQPYFLKQRGYDITGLLPYLYFDGEHSSAARHDYWRTVTEKYSEAYSKQLGDWCERNRLEFTGHYLWESALGVATRVGGAIMPHYRYQHVPGIDMLCEQTDEYMTVKQCTSVANQYGRRFVISEMYGCAGWEFTFEGQKWMGDWQYALGVNLRSQHLAQYSIRGCRKRDYPPFFNYQTSWWKYNRIVEDYFARLGMILTEGKPIRDILVLHPATTAWSMLGTNPYGSPSRGKDRDIPAIDEYGYAFNDLLRHFARSHYDFDLGDETIMAEAGAVHGGKLHVNQAAYKLVVLPPIRTMLRSTYELLLGYLDAGGKIIAMTPGAAMIEGRSSAEAAKLYEHSGVTIVSGKEEAVRALERHMPRPVSLRSAYGAEAPELLYMLKETDSYYSLFVVNNDRDRAVDVIVSTALTGRVERWDALNGRIHEVAVSLADGEMRFDAHFGPADSMLYIIYKEKPPAEAWVGGADAGGALPSSGLAVATRQAGAALEQAFGPAFGFTRTMPNVLTLDTCRFRLGDTDWSAEEADVWAAQRQIREVLGMRPVHHNGMTQRYKWIHEPHPNDGAPAAFLLNFEVADVPAAGVDLVIEGARHYRIFLNGMEVSNSPTGWFVDRSMDRVPLGVLVRGMNELELRCLYRQALEVEDVYLIGDFAVSPDRRIVKEPLTLHAGDWCLQGYYHYNGSIVYHADYEHQPAAQRRFVLELGDCSAVIAEIRVNGRTAGHIPWKSADGVDVTSYLLPGSNRLEIEVMGSPRNMFGPFHQALGGTPTTSCESFRKEGKDRTPQYLVHPYGLFGQIKLWSVPAR